MATGDKVLKSLNSKILKWHSNNILSVVDRSRYTNTGSVLVNRWLHFDRRKLRIIPFIVCPQLVDRSVRKSTGCWCDRQTAGRKSIISTYKNSNQCWKTL